MKRISLGIVTLALALTFVAPLTASASPSASEMLKEQVASQTMIRALTGNLGSSSQYVDWVWFGDFHATTWTATIPVYVGLHSGTTVTGTLILRKSAGYWYFYSITRGAYGARVSNVPIPAGLYPSVTGTSITEQKAHQWIITGILNHGYKKMTVASRSGNYGTRTVNVTLSRGSRHTAYARIVAYRRTATSGKQYWFLASLK